MVNEILEEREEQYGNAEDNFLAIGRIWGALLRIDDIKPHEVGLMMDALKTVRIFQNPVHKDSYDDKEGYLKLIREFVGV